LWTSSPLLVAPWPLAFHWVLFCVLSGPRIMPSDRWGSTRGSSSWACSLCPGWLECTLCTTSAIMVVVACVFLPSDGPRHLWQPNL
jgi:hypothetical protein